MKTISKRLREGYVTYYRSRPFFSYFIGRHVVPFRRDKPIIYFIIDARHTVVIQTIIIRYEYKYTRARSSDISRPRSTRSENRLCQLHETQYVLYNPFAHVETISKPYGEMLVPDNRLAYDTRKRYIVFFFFFSF